MFAYFISFIFHLLLFISMSIHTYVRTHFFHSQLLSSFQLMQAVLECLTITDDKQTATATATATAFTTLEREHLARDALAAVTALMEFSVPVSDEELDGIVTAVVALLKSTPHGWTQGDVLTCLARIASLTGTRLAVYFDWLSQPLHAMVFRDVEEHFHLLRCQALECLCALGLSVGPQRFFPFAQKVIEKYPSIPLDAPDAFAALCRALTTIVAAGRQALQDFLQPMLEHMLKAFENLPNMWVPCGLAVREEGWMEENFSFPVWLAHTITMSAPRALFRLLEVVLDVHPPALVACMRRIHEATSSVIAMYNLPDLRPRLAVSSFAEHLARVNVEKPQPVSVWTKLFSNFLQPLMDRYVVVEFSFDFLAHAIQTSLNVLNIMSGNVPEKDFLRQCATVLRCAGEYTFHVSLCL